MNVLGFGAIVWDEIEGERNIGGAVFNLLAHVSKLGGTAYLVSAVGNDQLGTETLEVVRSLGVSTRFIQTVDLPTCVIRVEFDDDGAPSYIVPELTAWDHVRVGTVDLDAINGLAFDYCCFGTLEQRDEVSRSALRSILDRCTFGDVFLDPTLRRQYTREILQYSLDRCTIAKMNEEEAHVVSETFGYGVTAPQSLIPHIARNFDIEIVCITAGSLGAYIGTRDEIHFCPSYEVSDSDTVGAGDAFGAGLIHKLHNGESLQNACDFGCRMGALVASKRGAVPDYELAELDEL